AEAPVVEAVHARDVGLPVPADLLGIDAPAGSQEARERAVEAVLHSLSSQRPGQAPRWLIVLDDVSDPADLKDLWPPYSPIGQTVVTTRRRDVVPEGATGAAVGLDVFTPRETVGYLRQVLAAHSGNPSDDELADLGYELGHLPLALAQAAAYIVEADCTVAAYRALLADRTRTLDRVAPELLPDGQRHPVSATWEPSLRLADATEPVGLATPMLRLAAFLEPNGIPLDVLTSARALAHLAAGRTPGSDVVPSEPDRRDAEAALVALYRLGLTDRTTTARSDVRLVRVHQLVQRAVRDALTPDEYGATATAAADALVEVWPSTEQDTIRSAALRANAATVLAVAAEGLFGDDGRIHPLLFRLGESLGESGHVTAAYAHYLDALAQTRPGSGPNHPDVLTLRARLAYWRRRTGDSAGAAADLDDIVADYARIVGPDDPDLLRVRAELAAARGAAGQTDAATRLSHRLVADHSRIHGPDHPDSLAALTGLATAYGQAGRINEAAALFEELVHRFDGILGPHHPQTIDVRHRLAIAYQQTGRVEEAIRLQRGVLAARERLIGREHADTLAVRANLATAYGQAGRFDEAVDMLEQVLGDYERLFPPEHPGTLVSRSNLGMSYGQAGRTAEAVRVLRRSFTECVRVLGPDHPDTLTTCYQLAAFQGRSGNWAEAVALLEHVLLRRRLLFGGEHHDTLVAREALAVAYGRSGLFVGSALRSVTAGAHTLRPSDAAAATPSVDALSRHAGEIAAASRRFNARSRRSEWVLWIPRVTAAATSRLLLRCTRPAARRAQFEADDAAARTASSPATLAALRDRDLARATYLEMHRLAVEKRTLVKANASEEPQDDLWENIGRHAAALREQREISQPLVPAPRAGLPDPASHDVVTQRITRLTEAPPHSATITLDESDRALIEDELRRPKQEVERLVLRDGMPLSG
ncbi:tetratricopeptide repeat protein, partial [Streptomyces cyaneofuscatus]